MWSCFKEANEEISQTTELLAQRLSAWKHAVEYLQNYIEAAQKFEHSNAKERERMLKV